MDKNKIFNEAHAAMISILEEMNLESLEQTEESILRYFDFLKSLQKLTPPTAKNKVVEESEEPSPDTILDKEADMSKEDKDILVLDRKLRGGILFSEKDDTKSIFLVEGIIRKESFKHGDVIKATQNNYGLQYDLIQSQPEVFEQSTRKQIDYCILTKRDSIWICESFYHEGTEKLIKLDEAPHSFRITEEDIREFGLTAGSIIDIAYYTTHPNRVKVVYAHSDLEQEHRTPNPSSYYKKTKTSEQEKKIEELLDFQDKTILVVGLEARKSKFKQEIELRGGKMLWASGNEERTRLESMVKKADLAVIIIQHTSHRGSIKTAEFCKKHKVKFCSTQSRGVESLLSAITNCMEELEFIS